MITAGIDVGSTATKAVIINNTEILGQSIIPTGWNPREAGRKAFDEALAMAGLTEKDVDRIIGTGYGRISLPFADKRITEISCHARGARFLFPGTGTVIDIGGQDSKVIALGEDGSVKDFLMNDKCAAGTGRFLQVMAGVLDITLDELGQLALEAEPAPINSMCTVFAESEIIGLLAQGTPKEAVAAGIIKTIAQKLISLTARLPFTGEITFSGGIANNPAICRILSQALGAEFNVSRNPQIVGALGAAVIGLESR